MLENNQSVEAANEHQGDCPKLENLRLERKFIAFVIMFSFIFDCSILQCS